MIDLNDHRKKVFSQFQEDGITEKIFELIGPGDKVCVEFGVGNGTECCSKIMWDRHGFSQTMFDNKNKDKSIGLHKRAITVKNVADTFKEYNIPATFDLLAIDINSYDFYVAHTILKEYCPRVLILEVNPTFLKEDKVVMLDHQIKGGYHGVSCLAWYKSLNTLGYSMVCHEHSGINVFFVYGDYLNQDVKDFNNFEALYRPHQGNLGAYAKYPDSWPILTSDEALNLI